MRPQLSRRLDPPYTPEAIEQARLQCERERRQAEIDCPGLHFQPDGTPYVDDQKDAREAH